MTFFKWSILNLQLSDPIHQVKHSLLFFILLIAKLNVLGKHLILFGLLLQIDLGCYQLKLFSYNFFNCSLCGLDLYQLLNDSALNKSKAYDLFDLRDHIILI